MASAKKKEQILNLEKYIDKRLQVKFERGREVEGKLQGFDTTSNLVLDDCVEFLRDKDDNNKRRTVKQGDNLIDVTRKLGVVVCRGTSIVYICPVDGTQEIPNPFLEDAETQQ